MGSYRESEVFYQRVLESIDKIEHYTQGVTYEEFCTNSEKQDACYMVVMTSEMRQLRNFIAHQYYKIDKRFVWNVITQELPKIKISILSQI